MLNRSFRKFCLAVFQRNPKEFSNIKNFIIFVRDEQMRRQRSDMGIQYQPEHRIACGVDFNASGTWLGVNLDTANYGFITNYLNIHRKNIKDSRFKRATLLMNFLQQNKPMKDVDSYEQYLQFFLEYSHLFNGTNIWLSNFIYSNITVMANN